MAGDTGHPMFIGRCFIRADRAGTVPGRRPGSRARSAGHTRRAKGLGKAMAISRMVGREAELVADYKTNGYTWPELMTKYDISRSTLSKILRRAGCRLNSERVVSDEESRKVVAGLRELVAYQDGVIERLEAEAASLREENAKLRRKVSRHTARA